jgi:hypothetical protein
MSANVSPIQHARSTLDADWQAKHLMKTGFRCGFSHNRARMMRPLGPIFFSSLDRIHISTFI